MRVIKRSIHTTSERMSLVCKCKIIITTHKRRQTHDFYVETQIIENHEEKNSLRFSSLQELQELDGNP